ARRTGTDVSELAASPDAQATDGQISSTTVARTARAAAATPAQVRRVAREVTGTGVTVTGEQAAGGDPTGEPAATGPRRTVAAPWATAAAKAATTPVRTSS